MKPSNNLPALIERYFTERLMRQRNVSANTIASYRDTFRLLFTFAQARLHKPPSGAKPRFETIAAIMRALNVGFSVESRLPARKLAAA